MALLAVLVASALVAAATAQLLPGNECSALLDLYDSTNGQAWYLSDGWQTGDTSTACEWFGVECTDGHVTGLFLSGNNLFGQLPESFGTFSMLSSLDLGFNHLYGELPVSFVNLTELYAVSLRENFFTGELRFTGLQNLAFVHLDFNSFTGGLEPLSASVQSLEVLGLTNNSLSGPLPQFLCDCPVLETLFLGGNSLTQGEFTKLPPMLTGLDLSRNKASTTLPKWFELPDSNGNVNTEIQEILLFDNQHYGTLLVELATLQDLIILDLHGNALSGSIPAPFATAPSMEILHLQNNQLTGQIPDTFQNCSVSDVDFSGNPFTCPIPDWASFTQATCQQQQVWQPPRHGISQSGFPTVHQNVRDAPPVQVEIYGEAKCPDFASIEQIFLPIMQQIGDITDLTLGFIEKKSPEYPTGFWSLHGQAEVLGNAYTACTTQQYSVLYALMLANCTNQDQYHIPLNIHACATPLGLDFEALHSCVYSDASRKLLEEYANMAASRNANWSPTIFINGELYCLWHSLPCQATEPEDFMKAICEAYTGTPPPPCSSL